MNLHLLSLGAPSSRSRIAFPDCSATIGLSSAMSMWLLLASLFFFSVNASFPINPSSSYMLGYGSNRACVHRVFAGVDLVCGKFSFSLNPNLIDKNKFITTIKRATPKVWKKRCGQRCLDDRVNGGGCTGFSYHSKASRSRKRRKTCILHRCKIPSSDASEPKTQVRGASLVLMSNACFPTPPTNAPTHQPHHTCDTLQISHTQIRVLLHCSTHILPHN